MADKKSGKILIVEDDEFLRSLAAKRLEQDDYDVDVAVDGDEAVKYLGKNVPDLVLLDLLLPEIDGFGVLEKMKKIDEVKDVPVVVFSNLGDKEDIERAKKLGANDYLVKANFTLDDVIQKINSYLK